MHQPADIGCELLCFRPRQKHAVVESVQKTIFRDPLFLLDEDPVHHRDLARGAAEAQQRNAEPDPKRH